MLTMSPTPKYLEDVISETDENKSDKKDFPYKITKVDDEINKDLLQYFTGERTGFVQVGPKKWFFPSGYEKNAGHYYNFQIRPDDVFIVTFPRSGTTWMQEMAWLLANDLNYQKATEIPLVHRFPFLEFSSFVHKETKDEFLKENAYDEERYQQVQNIDFPAWKMLTEMSGRRFIKTHLPFSLLPPNLLEVGCKVIYIARNPKDVAVSFYHLNRSIRTQGYVGDFPRYWNYFENNLQPWTPYWEHIKEGWSRRNEPNLLFFFYENISKNLKGNIEKVSKFLGKSYSLEQYETLADHLDIDNFRKNKSVNYDILKNLGVLIKGEEAFVRKGKSGGWKDYFDEVLNARADRWIEENLKDTDLRFPSTV
ncbi:estrogen sulfotransferase isoform X2 [Anoplophora glabripennis]|uniref:estrogen sulfotransferase isoform X2 n=1 Tax=Anoplophora glabripennis TaxID=217634 RepID=UPI0008755299|nr:estrogen sulfotransferase isoform X2 [Anoplophora glabripennis]